MQTVQYNNESYNIGIDISRINNKGEFIEVVEMVQDNISEFQIINDLSQPLLRCVLFVKDPESHITPKYNLDGRSFLNVEIEYTTNQNNKQGKPQKTIRFKHDFIINDIQIIDKTAENGTYKIFGVSDLVVPWLNKTYYSTNQQPKELTKIIYDIMKNSALKDKFKLRTPTQENQLNVNLNPVKNLNATLDLFSPSSSVNFNHCPMKANYITPVNHSLQDNIVTLLQTCHNDRTGLYCIPYNMLEDKLMLMSIDNEFKNNIIPTYNGIQISSKYGFSETEFVAKDEKTNNFISGINQYNLASTTVLNNFDYVNRGWSKDVYDQQRLDKFLPKSNTNKVEGKFESIFKPVTPKYTNRTQFHFECPSNFPFNMQIKMEEMYKFSQVLQFTLTGFIQRDVGQLFSVEASKSDTYYNKDAGTWMISRIYHTFSKEKYNQNVILIRSDKLIEQFRPQVNT